MSFYQTIPDLGVVGRMNTPEEFSKIGFPEDMSGMKVIDIGCNAGAFMIEAKKRGATALLGIEPNPHWREMAKENFEKLGHEDMALVDSSLYIPAETYDVVLLLSILHVTNKPQELLDKAWELAKEGGLLIVEINDRLQKESIKLPEEAKLYGKNKDNRSVYHCIKNNR